MKTIPWGEGERKWWSSVGVGRNVWVLRVGVWRIGVGRLRGEAQGVGEQWVEHALGVALRGGAWKGDGKGYSRVVGLRVWGADRRGHVVGWR